MAKIILAKESYAIVGACFAVYNEKGHCYTEPVFHECLEIEFEHLGIPFLSKPPLKLTYRGRTLTHTFEPDFFCFERIDLEIKAVSALTDAHRAQVINYVHTADLESRIVGEFRLTTPICSGSGSCTPTFAHDDRSKKILPRSSKSLSVRE